MVARNDQLFWPDRHMVPPSSAENVPVFNDPSQPAGYLDIDKIPQEGIPVCNSKDYGDIRRMYGPNCFQIIAVILDGCEVIRSVNPVLTRPGYFYRRRNLRLSVQLLFSQKTPSSFELETINIISEFARRAGWKDPKRWAEKYLVNLVRNIPDNENELRSPGKVDWLNTSRSMQTDKNTDIGLPTGENPTLSPVLSNTLQFVPFNYKYSQIGKPSKMTQSLLKKSSFNDIP
ncbi:hypothetical protein NEOLI_005187 [Neolecta irregularis DAH-3]|uniref:Uncharacterized protein n=1 Tax=Neolecta irregularis (strain DAH-3) TaxID=1198029 RepID=A0A1U7LL86_NEOID|nr:hypothetical protein NEOLI_005187 [Neolecta irregularis DAH-3]|eukprot:OLL23353.1 hypothetical protein NEOLI_005187 [Neolecta irregularis DAH-3]